MEKKKKEDEAKAEIDINLYRNFAKDSEYGDKEREVLEKQE